MAFYPSIRDETIMGLTAIVKNIEQDAGYLDSPECPYSETVKKFFRNKIQVTGKAGGGVFGDAENLFSEEEENVVLDQQVIKVINDLEQFGQQLGNGDVTEKMAYFRTKTALIEKLINMRERLSNLKEISDFRNIVLDFMNESCTKDQITSLMHRLDGVLGTKKDDLSRNSA